VTTKPVRAAAEELKLRFVVGTRLVLDDDATYLAWPTDRASYGRLTKLLSLGRMRAPKGQCQISRAEMLDHADGWVMAAVPPSLPDAHFAERLRADARDLRDRLGDAAPDRVGAARQSSPCSTRARAGLPASRDFR
jgi:error-prone DNA polymerase